MHPQSPPLTIGGTVLKDSDDLVILGVTFDSRSLSRNIFALFPEQILKNLVSLGSPGVCSMTDCFLGDTLGVSSCPFLSTVLQCGARLQIHTLNYWTV